jgi:hypothetical protein
VIDDDSVELVLSSGLINGKTWHFAVNPKGVMQDYSCSDSGHNDIRWNPEWQAKTRIETDRWEAEMTIPFPSLGQTPDPNECWQARFLHHTGGRNDLTPCAFPAKGTALLFFNSESRTDNTVLWWSGAPEREADSNASLDQQFTQAGWQIKIATTKDDLSGFRNKCDVFWFRHPAGTNKVPDDYWKSTLVPAVKNGALAVFVSYWNVPLEQYFNDPTLKVKVVSTDKLPLAGRRSQFIAPGDWSSKPNNLLTRLTGGITPAYGFIPENPDAWTILATAPLNETESFPYILAKPYGKGMIILCGDRIPISSIKMLENFVQYHKERREHKKPGEEAMRNIW